MLEGLGLSWGGSEHGELGDPGTEGRFVPGEVEMPSGVTYADISTGYTHCVALTSQGDVYCWGSNYQGQLGDGSETGLNVGRSTAGLVTFPTEVTITQISAGAFHGLALTSTGVLYGWGSNAWGTVGDGTGVDRDTPVLVALGEGVTIASVSAGWYHSVALTTAGEVLAWGYNEFGQLGDGTADFDAHPTPVLVDLPELPEGVTITAVDAATQHSLALTSAGVVLAWGSNQYGMLGDGTLTDRPTPVEVALPEGVTVTAIAGCSWHSLAVTSTGSALAWGGNFYGQLGDGSGFDQFSPVEVLLPTGTVLSSVGGREQTSLAVTSTGVALGWGCNALGQLGDGTDVDRPTPVEVLVPPDTTISKIDCIWTFGAAVTGTPPE